MTEIFKLEQTCISDAPDEYKKHVWENMKREMGLRLYELLEQQKTPVVIELFEDIQEFPHKQIKYWSDFYREYKILRPEFGRDKLRIELRFTPVEHRHVTYQVTPDMMTYLRDYKPSWISKIRNTLLKIWKSCETALLLE